MSITNKQTITILDDGDTWSGTGYVSIFGLKEMRDYLVERDWDEDAEFYECPLVEQMTDEQVEHYFWSEVQNDKAIRELDEVSEVYEIDRLTKFFLMARELGLDKIVWETLDGVEAEELRRAQALASK
jgi:hypothetical protein